MRRAALPALAGAVVLVCASACTPFGGDDPTTSSSTTGAGRQLDEAAARYALPIVADLPPGVIVSPTQPSGIEEQHSEPARCEEAVVSGPDRDALDQHKVAEATRSYTTESDGGSASVTIRSYDVEVPDALLEKAGQAVAECHSLTRTTTYEDGTDTDVSTMTLTGLAVPEVGEQAFVCRATVTKSSTKGSAGTEIDYLVFRRGHTLVSVVYAVGSQSTRVDSLPARLATATDRNLQEA